MSQLNLFATLAVVLEYMVGLAQPKSKPYSYQAKRSNPIQIHFHLGWTGLDLDVLFYQLIDIPSQVIPI